MLNEPSGSGPTDRHQSDRRILVVTSGRADASPLKPVVDALVNAGCSTHGISLEGYNINKACSRVQEEILYEKPDCTLLLGDRYETMCAAVAATYERIPIAHIHGGERSFGSFDNQFRDAITKLAHIHFVATDNARCRVVDELGEHEGNTYLVGAPGLDNAKKLKDDRIQKGHGFLVTIHPETLGNSKKLTSRIIYALSYFPSHTAWWTDVNNDPGSEDIRDMMREVFGAPIKYKAEEYIKAMQSVAVVIGNSSSGIIEAPTLHTPSVDIGDRQKGRERGPSVFHADADADDIERAIRAALAYDGPFDNPYDQGFSASEKIAEILSTCELNVRKEW